MPRVSDITIFNWLDRLIVERLESKCANIMEWANKVNFNWEHVLFIGLARAFGMKVNADAFENLLIQLNPNLIYKYANEPLPLKALLFGSAGFLTSSNSKDEYFLSLKDEYAYLKHLYGYEKCLSQNGNFYVCVLIIFRLFG